VTSTSPRLVSLSSGLTGRVSTPRAMIGEVWVKPRVVSARRKVPSSSATSGTERSETMPAMGRRTAPRSSPPRTAAIPPPASIHLRTLEICIYLMYT
jgi:hypothetical protein